MKMASRDASLRRHSVLGDEGLLEVKVEVKEELRKKEEKTGKKALFSWPLFFWPNFLIFFLQVPTTTGLLFSWGDGAWGLQSALIPHQR